MIKIRRATESDEKGIIELFKDCFFKDLSAAHWHWKYRLSPYGSLSYVAEEDNKIISHYGAILEHFRINDTTLKAYQFCDVMTHPKYRAKVFSKFPPIVKAGQLLYAENQMDFAFGFPSERHGKLQKLILGGSQPQKITVFYKNLTSHKKTSPLNLYRLTSGWQNIKDIDRLEQKSHSRDNITIIKNSNYINWRYKN
ncbi:hypothetical protein MCHI_003745, partial [Candidatus Magnetoovum chiemensis]